jgi:heat shock protein HslJ
MHMKKLIVGGIIVLVIGIGMVAILKEGSSPNEQSPMTLSDGPWVWTSAVKNDENITPKKFDAFVLTFTNDGKFSSSTDCNRLVGSYTANGANLEFGQIASTMMYCEGSQEAVYADLLSKVNSYTIDEGTLTLYLENNTGSMSFGSQKDNY